MPPSPAPRRPSRTRPAAPATAVGVAAALTLTACSADTAPVPDVSAPALPTAESSATPAEPSADPTPSGDPTPSDTPAPAATASEEPVEPAHTPAHPPFDEHTDRALQTIAALEATLGAGAFKIDGDDDGTKWKLELARGDERLKVKAEADATGLGTTKTDRDDLEDDDRDALAGARISLSEAIARVVETTGGVLDKAELEEDDGAGFWEVTVRTADDDEDYRVDLSTGAVTHDD